MPVVSAMVDTLCGGAAGVMLIDSMSVSVDGDIADREGGFGWTAPPRSCACSKESRASGSGVVHERDARGR
jgi:hypothetical protein